MSCCNTYRNLTIISPKYQANLFKRNFTLEEAVKQKSIHLKDKETMFQEIQSLKQEKNALQQSLKYFQAHLQYYKKEITNYQSNDYSPSKNYNKLKQSYVDKITTIEEENQKLKEKLQDVQAYLIKLKNPIENSNVELKCLQLQQDNSNLTNIVSTLEQENNLLQLQCNKLKIKNNVSQVQISKLKNLNSQLINEIGELKRKHNFTETKSSSKEFLKQDEKLIVELEEVKIELRNANQKINYWEQKYNNQINEDNERIDQLDRKCKELHKQFTTLQIQYQTEKQSYIQQQQQQQQQQNKFLRKTVILRNPNHWEEPIEQYKSEIQIPIKKNIQIEKNEVIPIAKKLKLRLISLKISLIEAEKHLITNDILTQQQIEENLHHQIFGFKDRNELHILASYLADIDNIEETTNAQRVKSIFKNLMENYVILSPIQLNQTNLLISTKKQEINDIIMKRYPETFTNGEIQIEQYLEILNAVDINLNKIEIDHLMALMTKLNQSSRILLQQIYQPFYIPEIHEPELNESKEEEEDVYLNNPLMNEHQINDNPFMSENHMSLDSGEQMSALDIKMVNSQELKKKSCTELLP